MRVIGNDAFQEADITGITMPVTKHTYKVMDPDEIPTAIAEAFHIASTGRPGPVLVDIPKDVLTSRTRFRLARRPSTFPATGRRRGRTAGRSRAAAELIRDARRPVLYVGGGVLKARAAQSCCVLAEAVGAPVVTTLMARGAFPDNHPLCLGMPGMHGNYAAVTAMQRSDLLITLGARFDDRVTGRLDGFAPRRQGHPRRHRSRRDRQEPACGRPDRRRCTLGHRPSLPEPCSTTTLAHGRVDLATWRARGRRRWTRDYPIALRASRGRPDQAAVRGRQVRRGAPTATPSSSPASASTRCGRRSSCRSTSPTRSSPRAAWARWASRFPPPSAQRSDGRTTGSSRSTATDASR